MENEIQKTNSAASAVKTWQQALVSSEGKFLAIVGNEQTTKKELGFAAQIIEGSDKLRTCSPESITNAVINVARTGITLNPVMKLAYLIPRGGKCVLDFSYVGLIKMLKDNNAIKFIDAFIVYEDELANGGFKTDTLKNEIHHVQVIAKSLEEQKKRKIYGAYTRSILTDGTVVFGQLMPMWEIEKRMQKSESKNSQYSPWQNWNEDMVKKTVIRRDFKFLIAGNPNDKLIAALDVEDQNNPLENTNGHVKTKTTVVFMEDAELVDETTGEIKAEGEIKPEEEPKAEKQAEEVQPNPAEAKAEQPKETKKKGKAEQSNLDLK